MGHETLLEDEQRALDKVFGDNDGNAAQLLDLAAAKVISNDLDNLYRGLQQLAESHGDRLVGFKDRFIKAGDSGYRDILLNVRLPNGHIGELRLRLLSVETYADMEHALYEVIRDIQALVVEQGRSRSTAEDSIIQGIFAHTNPLFAGAMRQGAWP